MKVKILILGAGPTGLTLGNLLQQKGENSFLVLEKEPVPGGLCRSVSVDGSPFDIGGGHFLDVKRPEVNRFLFSFLPESEWNLFQRDSRILMNGAEIGHPIEANIWQMRIEDQVQYLRSIAAAGCNIGEAMPEQFTRWIYWKLGDRIAEDYMIPYNRKIFSDQLDQLGTYWLQKLPNVSFEETLRSCLEKKAYGTQPGHASFYYPKKHGYGELWKRMGDGIKPHLRCGCAVRGIDFEKREVITDGESISAEIIFVTIPWPEFSVLKGMPEALQSGIAKLKYSSIETRYFETRLETKAHWIYIPDLSTAWHRILVRSNFCPGSRGYWTETNTERVSMLPENDRDRFRYMNQYAYPLNTLEKPEIMGELLSWTRSRGVIGIGRWGEWEHYNSDVSVAKAMEAMGYLTAGNQ